jgi:hypothetical protein
MNAAFNDEATTWSPHTKHFGSWAPAFAGVTQMVAP